MGHNSPKPQAGIIIHQDFFEAQAAAGLLMPASPPITGTYID